MRGIAVVVSLGLLATACGEREEPGPPPSPTAAVPSSPTTQPPPTGGPAPEAFRGRLVEVVTLQQPLAMAVRANDPALYFAEKGGRVVALRDGAVETVLDLSGRVSRGTEQGLLGIAFSPNGDQLYANWTDLAGDTHITEFPMRPGGTAARSAGVDLLVVDQPYTNHNGGHLAFGPDGYLYIALGDGGSAGDPQENAQNLGSVLGKILRVDPLASGGQPYTVPSGNPFVGEDSARPEVWAYGLRNPWRFSFDRANGDLWIADVGQLAREEIDLQPAAREGGLNFGWDGYEGTLEFEQPLPEDAEPPVYEYGRDQGTTVIGGYVYRGSEIPELHGAYIFGDHTNPRLRALVASPGGDVRHVALPLTVGSLTAFGEDAGGELYVMSLSGPVYRLAP